MKLELEVPGCSGTNKEYHTRNKEAKMKIKFILLLLVLMSSCSISDRQTEYEQRFLSEYGETMEAFLDSGFLDRDQIIEPIYDSVSFGYEYEQSPFETLQNGFGDCEDIHGVVAFYLHLTTESKIKFVHLWDFESDSGHMTLRIDGTLTDYTQKTKGGDLLYDEELWMNFDWYILSEMSYDTFMRERLTDWYTR